MGLLTTVWTSVLSIIVLFILTKLMGNKQLSQLSMFDYIIGISIGSIAAECSFENQHPERMVVAMLIYALSAYAVSKITEKSTHMRKLLIGRPLILFHNGKLYRENLKKARIDISDFLTHCRNQGYFDLSKLRTAVFEYNGSLSLLPVDSDRPLTPSDVQLEPVQEEIMVNVILDGHINDANLKKAGFERIWLEKQLNKQGYKSAKEIFLGIADTVKKTLQLYPMDVKNQTMDPFE
ncbi:DUF421 domain-containing protein [Ruminococcus sp. FC2018]|uniref:DUF421 domain-containing protein n=1 Tax=Ruminococcus sp. FC2018 TaxID=1410617 RepID=UPI0005656DDF|nr:DUF421 domain-containing protein [Ruminococcus sp. FC2018]